MLLTIHVPDELYDPVKHRFEGVTGILESVALDAVLGLLMRLDDEPPATEGH